MTARGRAGRAAGFAALILALLPGLASAQEPLSAIDWLSRSVATPVAPTLPPENPVSAGGALPDDIAVSSIDAPSPDGAGLLAPEVTGLPRDLWGLGRTAEIAALIARDRPDTLPALQGLLITLLLAEAQPPSDAGGTGVLLLARIDRLLALGAVDQARALLDAAGPGNAEMFRRSFDVALLTGDEDAACETLRADPGIAPTFPARVFCLARSGDWNAAALSLRTGQALGFVTPAEDALLSRFLDPDLFEGEPPLDPPLRPTPLEWRMFEAIGEPLATATLPIAFAHAELRNVAGWKAQLEAAERLARAGVITPNQMLGYYTERLPAASGGIWDRVEAFQAFEAALAKKDTAGVTRTLPVAYARMAQAELEVPFATLHAGALRSVPLTGDAARVALTVGLLSPDYEAAARTHVPLDAAEAFLVALATGKVEGVAAPDSLARAILPAFLAPLPTPEALVLLEERRLGEAILQAIDRIGRGVQGDARGVTEGLSLLRHVGLEDVARRTALELMLLERRG